MKPIETEISTIPFNEGLGELKLSKYLALPNLISELAQSKNAFSKCYPEILSIPIGRSMNRDQGGGWVTISAGRWENLLLFIAPFLGGDGLSTQ